MPYIRVKYKNGRTDEVPIDGLSRITVGRMSGNTIVVSDAYMSREHFVIELRDGTYNLTNLSSSSGTMIKNDKVTEPVALDDNDIILAGQTYFVLCLTGQPSAPAESPPSPDETPVAIPAPPKAAPAARPQRQSLDNGAAIPPALRENLQESVLLSKFDVPEMLKGVSRTDDASDFAIDKAKDQSASLRWRMMQLQEIGQEMVTRLDIDSLLEFILEKIFELFKPDNGLILLRNPDTEELTPKALRLKSGHTTTKRLRISHTLLDRCFKEHIGILTEDAQSDDVLSAQKSIMAFAMRSVMCVPLIFRNEILGAIHVDSESHAKSFTQEDLDVLTMMSNQAALSVHNSRLHERILEEQKRLSSLERYFSPQLAQRIARREIELETGGQSIETTVMFSDIRGFTQMSENMSPAEIVQFCNEYFTKMSDFVFEHGGTLDKFIGDALMAVFGSPIPVPDPDARAVRCACDMIRCIRESVFSGGHSIEIGIGIHRGKVVHGNIGSQKVMQYTCVGNTVNTASRLCSQAKHNQIIISEDVRKLLGDEFDLDYLGNVELKGKKGLIRIFEVKV